MVKNLPARTSLVVQWVRPHTPNAGGQGSIPGWGTSVTTKSSHAATKRAYMPQRRSHMPQLRPRAAKINK